MKFAFWLTLLVFAATVVWVVVHVRRRFRERARAEAARAAELLAGFVADAGTARDAPAASSPPELVPRVPAPKVPAAPTGNSLVQQKLLFDAAHKAGEAGEPALGIQLYARLLARYPATTFADAARAAIEAQKKKLPKE